MCCHHKKGEREGGGREGREREGREGREREGRERDGREGERGGESEDGFTPTLMDSEQVENRKEM